MSKKAKYLVLIISLIGLMTYLIRTHSNTQEYASLEIPKIKLKKIFMIKIQRIII